VNSAIASPGPSNTAGTVSTVVEAVTDGIAKGFVLPGGSLTITGDNPATVTLPDTPGAGVPIEITQGAGTFCAGGCTGPATTISPFDGYTDPAHPITAVLNFLYPDDNNGLTQAALDFVSATIYKQDESNVTTTLSNCVTPGQANPEPNSPCVDGRAISHTSARQRWGTSPRTRSCTSRATRDSPSIDPLLSADRRYAPSVSEGAYLRICCSIGPTHGPVSRSRQ
jgi:hypothetical protein